MASNSEGFKFPTLSGDFDSLEVTENQQKLLDILKAFGKMSLIASDSSAKYRVEKVGGLESYLYQVNKLMLGQPTAKLTPEIIEELERECRYEEREEKIGNKTEFLRVLLGNAHSNPKFKQLVDDVIKEQEDLARKRADNRYFAEKTQADNLGL